MVNYYKDKELFRENYGTIIPRVGEVVCFGKARDTTSYNFFVVKGVYYVYDDKFGDLSEVQISIEDREVQP